MSSPDREDGIPGPPDREIPVFSPKNTTIHSPTPKRPSPIHLNKSFPRVPSPPPPPPPPKDTPRESSTSPRAKDYFSVQYSPQAPSTPPPRARPPTTPPPRIPSPGTTPSRTSPPKTPPNPTEDDESEDNDVLSEGSGLTYVRVREGDGGSVFDSTVASESGKSISSNDVGDSEDSADSKTSDNATAYSSTIYSNSSEETIRGVESQQSAQATTTDRSGDGYASRRAGNPNTTLKVNNSKKPPSSSQLVKAKRGLPCHIPLNSEEEKDVYRKCMDIRCIASGRLRDLGINIHPLEVPFSRPETEAAGFRWIGLSALLQDRDKRIWRKRRYEAEDDATIQFTLNSHRLGTCPETWTKREREIMLCAFMSWDVEPVRLDKTMHSRRKRRENVPWKPPVISEPAREKRARRRRKSSVRKRRLEPFVKLEDFPSPPPLPRSKILQGDICRMEDQQAQEETEFGIDWPDVPEVLAQGPPQKLYRRVFDEESMENTEFEYDEERECEDEEEQEQEEEVIVSDERAYASSIRSEPTRHSLHRRTKSEPSSIIELELGKSTKSFVDSETKDSKERATKEPSLHSPKASSILETPRKPKNEEKDWWQTASDSKPRSARDSVGINLESMGLIETPESKRKKVEKKVLKAFEAAGTPSKPPRWPFKKRLFHPQVVENANVDEVVSKEVEAPPRQVTSMLNEIGLTDKQKKRLTLHKSVSDPLLLNTASGQMVKEELAYHRFTTNSSKYAEPEAKTIDVADLGASTINKHPNFWRNKFHDVTRNISPPPSLKSTGASIRKFRNMDIGSLLYAKHNKLTESRRLYSLLTEKLHALEATILSIESTQPFMSRQLAAIENYKAILTRKLQESQNLTEEALGACHNNDDIIFRNRYQAELALLQRQADTMEEVMNVTACEYMVLQDEVVELQEEYKTVQEEIERLQKGVLRFGEIWKKTLVSYAGGRRRHCRGGTGGGGGGGEKGVISGESESARSSPLQRKGSLLRKYREDKESLKGKQESIGHFYSSDDEDEEEKSEGESCEEGKDKPLPKTPEPDQSSDEEADNTITQETNKDTSSQKKWKWHMGMSRRAHSEDNRRNGVPGGGEMSSIYPRRGGRSEEVLARSEELLARRRDGLGEMFSGSGFFN